ncbi:MAG: porin family protein [Polaribacter sp.]
MLFIFTTSLKAQKDSLKLGDRYADDQIYASISYAQFSSQPSVITRSNFSYAISTGFLKDFILNKQGNISVALGIGYGYNNFNHELKVDEVNGSTVFNNSQNINANFFRAHNLEIPLELRWRTSTAQRYSFWRVYTGIKFLYNLSNSFEYLDANDTKVTFTNVSSYRKLQYGLTLSAGYDEFNMHVFYGLSPIFENAKINSEDINTTILKIGLIFYIL